MNLALAYPIAIGATLLTTLSVLALWVLHSRVVDHDRVDSVLLSYIFLFVPLIFFVSTFSNVVAVTLGQLAALVAPSLARWGAVGAAGVLVWLACGWSQRGLAGFTRSPPPMSIVPVMLFCLTDMLILAGGLSLIPASPSI